MRGKAIIFSAPSGSGKTTIVNHLIKMEALNLEFSISASTRAKRDGEVDGKDYYFLSVDQFKTEIEENSFIEWEEVYKSLYYGTYRSEVTRIWEKGKIVIFDVDVMGGINLKKQFGNDSLSIFVMPPSIEELQKRLEKRGTDPAEKIRGRIAKAKFEMKKADNFDKVLINDDLNTALKDAEQIIKEFVKS